MTSKESYPLLRSSRGLRMNEDRLKLYVKQQARKIIWAQFKRNLEMVVLFIVMPLAIFWGWYFFVEYNS